MSRSTGVNVKSGAKWAVILGMVLFMGYVVVGTMTRGQVTCEVCLEFDGEMVCRRGAGPTQAEAQLAAQESACGGNASGITESTMCRNRTPDRLQCSTG